MNHIHKTRAQTWSLYWKGGKPCLARCQNEILSSGIPAFLSLLIRLYLFSCTFYKQLSFNICSCMSLRCNAHLHGSYPLPSCCSSPVQPEDMCRGFLKPHSHLWVKSHLNLAELHVWQCSNQRKETEFKSWLYPVATMCLGGIPMETAGIVPVAFLDCCEDEMRCCL